MPPPALTKENYRFLQEHVYRATGIVLDDTKHYLLESRLQPIAASRALTSLNDLCQLLRAVSDNSLHQELVNAITTNETLFFRDPAFWNALKRFVIPSLAERRDFSKRLRCWSAASSSGQEIYSLAITLIDMGFENWLLDLTGTDISSEMLTRAASGVYGQLEINRGLPAHFLASYFEKYHRDWRVCDRVRQRVRFTKFDLRSGPFEPGGFDLILCRNVLIYFDLQTKDKILANLRGSVSPDGYLVLGSAESIWTTDYWKAIHHDTAIVYEPVGAPPGKFL